MSRNKFLVKGKSFIRKIGSHSCIHIGIIRDNTIDRKKNFPKWEK